MRQGQMAPEDHRHTCSAWMDEIWERRAVSSLRLGLGESARAGWIQEYERQVYRSPEETSSGTAKRGMCPHVNLRKLQAIRHSLQRGAASPPRWTPPASRAWRMSTSRTLHCVKTNFAEAIAHVRGVSE